MWKTKPEFPSHFGLLNGDCKDELHHSGSFRRQQYWLRHVSPHVLSNCNLYRWEFVAVSVAPGPPGPQLLGGAPGQYTRLPRSGPHDEASILQSCRDEQFLVLDTGEDSRDWKEGVPGFGHDPHHREKTQSSLLYIRRSGTGVELLNRTGYNINHELRPF